LPCPPKFSEGKDKGQKMSSQRREIKERQQSKETNKMRAKIISKILSVKQVFHRLRQDIHWLRSGIKCGSAHHVIG
jgi:hypothetical protein